MVSQLDRFVVDQIGLAIVIAEDGCRGAHIQRNGPIENAEADLEHDEDHSQHHGQPDRQSDYFAATSTRFVCDHKAIHEFT